MEEKKEANESTYKCMKTNKHNKEYSMKQWVLRLVISIIVIGLILPLFAEIIVGIFWPNNVKGIEVWNQFISVVLGIVATVLSMVSIFLGFKSYDDSAELMTISMQSFDHIKNVESEVDWIRTGFLRYVIDGTPSWSPENVAEK